jgi:hypothetical protein
MATLNSPEYKAPSVSRMNTFCSFFDPSDFICSFMICQFSLSIFPHLPPSLSGAGQAAHQIQTCGDICSRFLIKSSWLNFSVELTKERFFKEK